MHLECQLELSKLWVCQNSTNLRLVSVPLVLYEKTKSLTQNHSTKNHIKQKRKIIRIYSRRKVVVVDGCCMKSLGEIKFTLFRWWRWVKFFLNKSRGGALKFRYCWWHFKHFSFITRIVCIKSTFRALTCDVFCFTFWKSKRFYVSNGYFSCRVVCYFFCLRTILLMVTFFDSVLHYVHCVDPHGLIFIPSIR